MNRTLSISLAMLTVLLGSTLTAAAAASAPRGSVTVSAERAFQIDMATNRAVLTVSGAAVSRAGKRESALLTACLTRDLMQISDESQSHAHAEKVLELLSEEAGVEYAMAAIQPVLRPLLNGVTRLLSLRLPPATRATMKSFLSAFARVRSLNACADARAWLAAGLGVAQEPRATAQLALTLTDFHKLGNLNVRFQLGGLPPAQLHALKVGKTQANKHVNQLIARADASLESWIRQLVAKVERATSITTTPTTAGTTATGTTKTWPDRGHRSFTMSSLRRAHLVPAPIAPRTAEAPRALIDGEGAADGLTAAGHAHGHGPRT